MKKLFYISFIILTFIQLFTSNIFAQRDMFSKDVDSTMVEEQHVAVKDTSFSLTNYYTPDIVRNKLEISLNSNGNLSSSNYSDSNTGAFGSSYLNGTLNTVFESYANTRKHISLMQVTGNFNANITSSNTKNTITDLLNKTVYNDNLLSFSYNNRMYNSNNQYLLLGGYISFQATTNNQSQSLNNTSTDNKQSTTEFYVAPTFGVGMGRIESVEDARQTLYIVDALSKAGVLSRELSNDELFKLTQIISLVKNKRFLDSRLHLMEEITAVDSFFVKNSLLDKSDAAYFTTLYDNWENGALFERKAGQTVEVSLTPYATWGSGKNSQDTVWNKSVGNRMGGNLAISYSLEKPASLYLQHSVSAQLRLFSEFPVNNYTYSSTSVGSTVKSNNSGANVSLGYSLGFYPNSRTYFQTGISENAQLAYQKDINTGLSDSNPWTKSIFSNTSFNLSAYYYVSAQMRISVSGSVGDYYSVYSTYNNNSIQGAFSATIRYSFF